jgi:hypothetical protein
VEHLARDRDDAVAIGLDDVGLVDAIDLDVRRGVRSIAAAFACGTVTCRVASADASVAAGAASSSSKAKSFTGPKKPLLPNP